MRKLVLALSMAVMAAVGMTPAVASAEITSVPAPSVNAAVDAELNIAVAGTPPPKSQMECRSYTQVEICWEKAGDYWWVQDQDSTDKSSAGVWWMNFRNHTGGELYRQGYCITSLGKGNWGRCNKNYYEDSRLYGNPCIWNRPETVNINCDTEKGHRYQ
jgi:hypothetical protein